MARSSLAGLQSPSSMAASRSSRPQDCAKDGCLVLPGKVVNSGWQGVCLVAITYVYFLIFAQFAFINRLSELGILGAHLKAVMGAMAFGGILFSLLTPR